MSGQFEQTFASSDGDSITYIQYIQPEGEGEHINVLIPNFAMGSGMREEYLEEDEPYEENECEGIEVLESVVNISKKQKIKVEPETKELVQISDNGKPKGRKRIVPDQTRAIRKMRANTNQAYINSKGKEVQPKEFDESFVCTCPKKCTQGISLKTRKQIFNIFWSIGTYEGRCAFLNSCINEAPKKRQYTKNESRRKMTRKYYLKGVEVCKTTFTRTLKISNSRIDVSLSKMENDLHIFKDERGKSQNKGFTDNRKAMVVNHIKETFNENSGIRSMWKDFQDTHPEKLVSESYYKRVFYENFNLKVKKKREKKVIKQEELNTDSETN